MDKEWKKTLFESPTNEFTLNPLGFPLSRTKGAEILGVCFRTWMRWEELAMNIPEYKLQHIQLGNRANQFGVKPPVLPYMVWCCGKVGEIFQNLPHGLSKNWMVQAYIKERQQDFTRDEYQKEQQRFAELVLEETT